MSTSKYSNNNINRHLATDVIYESDSEYCEENNVNNKMDNTKQTPYNDYNNTSICTNNMTNVIDNEQYKESNISNTLGNIRQTLYNYYNNISYSNSNVMSNKNDINDDNSFCSCTDKILENEISGKDYDFIPPKDSNKHVNPKYNHEFLILNECNPYIEQDYKQEDNTNQIIINNEQFNSNIINNLHLNIENPSQLIFQYPNMNDRINALYKILTGDNKENIDMVEYAKYFVNILLNSNKKQYSNEIIDYLRNNDNNLKQLYDLLTNNIIQNTLVEIRNTVYIKPTELLTQLESKNMVNDSNKHLIHNIIILTAFNYKSFNEFYNAIFNPKDLFQKQDAISTFNSLLECSCFENYLDQNLSINSLEALNNILSQREIQSSIENMLKPERINNICSILEKHIQLDINNKQNNELQDLILSIIIKLKSVEELNYNYKSFRQFNEAIFNPNNKNKQLDAINSFILLLQHKALLDYFTATGCAKPSRETLNNCVKSNKQDKTFKCKFDTYLSSEMEQFVNIFINNERVSSDENIQLLNKYIKEHQHVILYNINKLLNKLEIPNFNVEQQNIFVQKRDAIMLALSSNIYNSNNKL